MRITSTFLAVAIVSASGTATAEDINCRLEAEGVSWRASCLLDEGHPDDEPPGPWKGRCLTAAEGDVAPSRGYEKVVVCRVENKRCNSVTDLLFLLDSKNRRLSHYYTDLPFCGSDWSSELSAIDVIDVVHDVLREVKVRNKRCGSATCSDGYTFLKWKNKGLAVVLYLPLANEAVRSGWGPDTKSTWTRSPSKDADAFLITTTEISRECEISIAGCTDEEKAMPLGVYRSKNIWSKAQFEYKRIDLDSPDEVGDAATMGEHDDDDVRTTGDGERIGRRLSKAEVRTALDRVSQRVSACLDEANTVAVVDIEVIGYTGLVKSVAIRSPVAKGPMQRCIHRALGSTVFPRFGDKNLTIKAYRFVREQ